MQVQLQSLCELLCLCVGVFDNISLDMDWHLCDIAVSRALFLFQERGHPLSDKEASRYLSKAEI